MSINYDAIPEELKWERAWALAYLDANGQSKAPHVLSPRGPVAISPTQSFHWKDFETTCDSAALVQGAGIGYILSKADKYTVIDLDVKNEHNEPDESKWTSQENIDRYHRIITAFESYTERSASGQGFHIWVRGDIGRGLKRDGVEVYSQERFIVCTGDVYVDVPIADRQDLLNVLVAEIKAGQPDDRSSFQLVEVEPTESDDSIWQRARDADNADKFVKLCKGEWSGEYPSQSEADLALMSIFAFYSKSNSQCRRMFRQTKLGERPKATKNDVAINRTLTVIRARQENAELADAHAALASAQLVANLSGKPLPPPIVVPPPLPAFQGMQAQQPSAPFTTPLVNLPKPPIPFPEEVRLTMEDPQEENTYTPPSAPAVLEDEEQPSTIDWPPGMVGALAQYIYATAPRPVREIAIVAALGLMAGICGKAYNVSNSGLNQYIVLIARSAIGKETLHSGIANLMQHVNSAVPAAMSFVDFSDYASGPALTKGVAANPSFVNVSGEWGKKLKRLADEDGRDSAMQTLRTVMTNLYQKSGAGSIVGGIGYSNKENNVASITGASYSLVGESTPGGFYEALTETMMEDGFLSRFTIIEYTGDRPPANPTPASRPDSYLLDRLCEICQHSLTQIAGFRAVDVLRNSAAGEILKDWDLECDDTIRAAGEDESIRQMWNRAHLKTMRIAALLAVGDNFVEPTMTAAHVNWAKAVVVKGIEIMQRRMESGDVGMNDNARERKLLSVMKKYLKEPVPKSYKVSDAMRLQGIVPRKYLQMAVSSSTAFAKHRSGSSNQSLDLSIRSLIDSGWLTEYPKDKAIAEFEFHGKCYRIINLPDR